MFQIYVKNSANALEFYQKAFGAKTVCVHKNSDGTIAHAELDVHGQTLALTELTQDKPFAGNTMQFCLHFGGENEEIVRKIFDALKDGAEIHYPLNPCEWSPLMFGLIDRFGVNWCIFV